MPTDKHDFAGLADEFAAFISSIHPIPHMLAVRAEAALRAAAEMEKGIGSLIPDGIDWSRPWQEQVRAYHRELVERGDAADREWVAAQADCKAMAWQCWGLEAELARLAARVAELEAAIYGMLRFIKEFDMGGDWEQSNYPAVKAAWALLSPQPPTFDDAAKKVLDKNTELYQRLANQPPTPAARYKCGCEAVKSDKVKAFCPAHHEPFPAANDKEQT